MLLSMSILWEGAVAQTEVGADAVSNTLIPIVSQLGFGVVVGFIVGFTLKQVGKLVAIVLGLIFILIQGLAYSGIITVQWEPIMNWWLHFTIINVLQGHWETVSRILLSNIPSFSGAIPGLLLGFKMR
jgi:uncharacterized membrane protein (Fun14 family)